MHLTPREVDKLLIFSAGELARQRRTRGLKLNHPEAVALITSEILELIRDGKSVAEITSIGSTILPVDAVMEGVGTPEAIDAVMKLGMNHPMGPLTLADFIGLDICLAILNVLHDGLGDPKYRPCPLLRRMVAAGHLGRKSGQGFYTY